jgi:hypothetical protein
MVSLCRTVAKAILRFHTRRHSDDGAFVEMKIREVPTPVAGSKHRLKYSLFFGRHGERIVGYDYERGKGDHKHIRDVEHPYEFSTVERLIIDFIADIDQAREPE